MAGAVEAVRRNTVGFLRDYFILLDVRDENSRLRAENGQLKIDNQYLKTELSTADRARALAAFQSRSQSKTIAARIIGNGTGANSMVAYVDRGTRDGVSAGMAVITPDGIVGKVVAAYPTASQVLLISDPTFAAGVISQKNRVHGTLKGQGHSTVLIDWVQNEEKVEVGEWFFTSGDDLVFPKGLPVGQANVVRDGRTFKEIFAVPSGLQNGLEEVLIVIEGVHQPIPEQQTASQEIKLQAPPPPEPGTMASPAASSATSPLSTDADRLRERYKRIGVVEKHTYGVGAPGSKPPDFNVNPDQPPAPAREAAQQEKQPPIQ